jgi:hypothetical protein
MSDLSALSRVTLALSGFLARFQRWLPDMSDPQHEHVRVSDTQWLYSLGCYKRPPCLCSKVGHSVQLANILRHSLELPTSHLQASFKSKLPMRDLSLALEWLTRSSTQEIHRRSLCVRYSWGFISLDGLGCLRVTKVVVDFRKFVLD